MKSILSDGERSTCNGRKGGGGGKQLKKKGKKAPCSLTSRTSRTHTKRAVTDLMLIYRICRQDRRELRKMNKEFGILLFQLSQSLERDEIDAIRFIEELPADLEGKSGLHVLVKLQMQGNITVTDPSTLQGVFKNINRMDLVNRVKEFIKSQKKKKRKIVPNYEELLFGLKANLAVSHLQAKLLCDQLRNQAYAAEMSGMTSVQQITLEAISFVENEVERRLICAKEEMVRKNNSSPELSDDDETQSRTLQQGGNTELASSIIQGLFYSIGATIKNTYIGISLLYQYYSYHVFLTTLF